MTNAALPTQWAQLRYETPFDRLCKQMKKLNLAKSKPIHKVRKVLGNFGLIFGRLLISTHFPPMAGFRAQFFVGFLAISIVIAAAIRSKSNFLRDVLDEVQPISVFPVAFLPQTVLRQAPAAAEGRLHREHLGRGILVKGLGCVGWNSLVPRFPA